MKKRILMCTEASFYPTGYGVYTKELLSRLHKNPNFEVAELACYASQGNPRLKDIPWAVYPNKPKDGTPEMEKYLSSPTFEYGEFSFNTVCLNFRPHFVIDIRDPWAFEFQTRSPFRKFFKHVIMPTVDAEPQNPEWIDMFAEADAVLTYSEFGAATIKSQTSNVNHIGIASPCASDNFFPVEDKDLLRAKYGLPLDAYIVGTVMRNQRRKLYPELFRDFAEYLFRTGRKDVYLYCHTSFPDVGWDIPELLMKYGLSHRVLFTYKCKDCGNVTTKFFNDTVSYCQKCNSFKNFIVGVSNGTDEEELAEIYNLFDIYVQYANSEGFGMPQLEAAKCGNVVVSVNYSAMSSVIDNIDAVPLRVLTYIKECETGCMRAIPDGEYFVGVLRDLCDTPKENLHKMGLQISKKASSFYSWDKTAKEWSDFFEATDVEDLWFSPSDIRDPAPINNKLTMPLDRANFLVSKVLGRPDLVGKRLWRRCLKDLTYGLTVESSGGFYFNESHLKDNLKQKIFTYEDAYKYMSDLREYYNIWERHREKALLETR